MSVSYKTLVFCDNCAALAVAELDRAPLCMSCLLMELRRGGPHRDLSALPISPLSIRRAPEQHPGATPAAEVA